MATTFIPPNMVSSNKSTSLSHMSYHPLVADLPREIHKLLTLNGSSMIEPTAYDTAWVARLGEADAELSCKALEWLRTHQLADGAWGAEMPLYHHDRVICTLAAIIALIRNGAPEDRWRVAAALPALHDSLAKLPQDLAGRTVAFEMLLPSLIVEAKTVGIEVHDPDDVVGKMMRLRDAKLARTPKGMINRQTTLGFSAEMVGPGGLDMLDVDNLQQEDGSICISPAATAFFVTYIRPAPAALQYLRRIVKNGGAPTVTTFEVFERAWSLWNLTHAGAIDQSLLPVANLSLEKLESMWRSGQGISMNKNFVVVDGDDTGLVSELFGQYGRPIDLDAIWSFEDDHYFRCYSIEHGSSVGTNVHIMGALRQAGLPTDHPVVQKVAKFLHAEQINGGYWTDKWHSSPYYVTSHAITTFAGYKNEVVQKAVQWMIDSQRADGSWGYFSPTAEETAYCLMALMTWHRYGLPVAPEIIECGAAWLLQHVDDPHPPLWIGKSLYIPTLVVRSALLSAIHQYVHEFVPQR
jgi:halimadienyl-diphosphate synthase